MGETAEHIAQSGGGEAHVHFEADGYAPTINDARLTAQMTPSLERVPGGKAMVIPKGTGGEDFSFFAQKAPGLFVMIGATPVGKDASKAEPFAPLWRAFLTKRASLRDQPAARRFFFLLEELRVSLFAPELKPAQPVSIAAAAQALAALR